MARIFTGKSLSAGPQAKALVRAVKKAADFSYVPYSKIRVSAGLLAASDRIYTGVNVENASYSLTICAERSAVYQAYAVGERRFRLILLWSPQIDFIMPCGACLQVLAELAPEIVVATMNRDEEFKYHLLAALLRMPFRM